MKYTGIKSIVLLGSVLKSRAFFQPCTQQVSRLGLRSLHMERSGQSVTGLVYQDSTDATNAPMVQLYTKEGCTLCDKVSDVLKSLREECPHSLEAIDITDEGKEDIYDKYKWDIPVLHIEGKYWTKHKLTSDEAVEAITKATNGEFEVQRGEPDAGALERRREERERNAKA